jgi:pilus assembly protein CpaE
MGLVREALAADAVLPNSWVQFGDAIDLIRRTRPDVVVVGYTRSIDAALALAEAITKSGFGTTLIALAERSDAEAILAAMRVGYKEFIVLPDDSARLRQVVHDSAYATSDEEERGHVVAITGAKGGVGNTVLSIHLGTELAAIHRVLVIDLDFGMGDLAPLMDLGTRENIAELLPRADRLDERSLTGSVSVHRSKLHVLATPEDIEQIGEVRADDVYAIINAASKAYQYVILDCGAYYDEGVAMAINVADTIVMVTTPDVTCIRNTFRRYKMLNSLGVDKERIRLVVNKWDKNTAFVALEDISENLGVPVAASISLDTKVVDQAVNEGKLIREVNKRSEVARDIMGLVAILTEKAEVEDEHSESVGLGGFFRRMMGKE